MIRRDIVPVLNRISATRIVATPAALDAATWPAEALVLRFAPDEVFITPPAEQVSLTDPHTIVIAEGGYAGLWLSATEALDFLERACEWELPSERPAFAQGAVAGIPAKLWLETERVLFIIPAPYAADFEERLV
jgi:hypothetical protein